MKNKVVSKQQPINLELYGLEKKHDLALYGLKTGFYFTILIIISTIAIWLVNTLAAIKYGKPILSGMEFIAGVGILVAGLIIYFAFVFNRLTRIKTDLSQAKQSLEITVGD